MVMTEYKGFTIDCTRLTKVIYGNEILETDSYNYHILKGNTYYLPKETIKTERQAKNIITRIINGTYYKGA